eukprot:104039_1
MSILWCLSLIWFAVNCAHQHLSLDQHLSFDQHLTTEQSLFHYYASIELFYEQIASTNHSNNVSLYRSNKLFQDEVAICKKLAKWIYSANITLEDIKHKKVFVTNKTNYQMAQWALSTHKKHPTTLFLSFRGTDSQKAIDILADLSALPHPIYPPIEPSDIDTIDNPELFVHSGIYTYLMRDYKSIWREIRNINKEKSFNKLIITGHSLGGGLSKLFALRSLIDNQFVNINCNFQVITFAAPLVISTRMDPNLLSLDSRNIYFSLHSKTICFVNRFDIVPRILVHKKWILFIIDALIKRAKSLMEAIPGYNGATAVIHSNMGSQKFTETMSAYNEDIRKQIVNPILAVFWNFFNKTSVSEKHTNTETIFLDDFVRRVTGEDEIICYPNRYIESIKYNATLNEYKFDEKNPTLFKNEELIELQYFLKDLLMSSNELETYEPCGTYIFYLSQCDEPFVIDDNSMIKSFLLFLPPILITHNDIFDQIIASHFMDNYILTMNNDIDCSCDVENRLHPELSVANYWHYLCETCSNPNCSVDEKFRWTPQQLTQFYQKSVFQVDDLPYAEYLFYWNPISNKYVMGFAWVLLVYAFSLGVRQEYGVGCCFNNAVLLILIVVYAIPLGFESYWYWS